jgi:hypothetical protein
MEDQKVIKGFKGFDKEMKCKDFQYEVGKTYTTDDAIICEKGFHFCENPIDVFGYYAPAGSRFAEVEGTGKTAKHNDDSKVACTELHVKAELSLSTLVGVGVKFIFDKVDWKNKKETNTGYRSAATNTGNQSAATNTGDQSAATNTGNRSAATNTGNQSAATNTGDRSAATNTGDQSAATVEGKESIACGFGYQCMAKGSLGCWIVLAERDDGYKIKTVKTAKVDGKKIKADTFYQLKNGKFVVLK